MDPMDGLHRIPVPRELRRLTLPALLLAALVLAAAGCGGSSESADLVGTYTTTLGPSGPELKEANPPGRWQLLLTSPTEAYFQPPEGPSFPVGNPVATEDDRVTFGPDAGCPTQTGAPGNGTYTWSLDGDILTFTEVEDTCRDRVFVLTSQPWKKEG
jgi:hypothetical protein